MSQDTSSQSAKPVRPAQHLPAAFDHFDEITRLMRQNAVLCLDYDGTLSPIVPNPKDAVLSGAMRQQLQAVAQRIPVVIVSGRGLPFIRQQVALDDVYYAGSHGFEIVGPGGFQHELQKAQEALPLLDRTEQALVQKLSKVEGAEVERKKYGIAIHYRRVAEAEHATVKQAVKALDQQESALKLGKGKMVLELKPNIDWHKGKAIHFIADHIIKSGEAPFLVYIGDDLTDEDAFQSIQHGAGILVGSHSEDSAADYHLDKVEDVQRFLKSLTEKL